MKRCENIMIVESRTTRESIKYVELRVNMWNIYYEMDEIKIEYKIIEMLYQSNLTK